MVQTTVVLESLWNALAKRMPEDEATRIMNDVRDAALIGHKNINITQLHTEVANCQRCKDFEYQNRTAVWNIVDPDVLVVLERPNIGRDASLLITEALDSAGFNKDNSALSYLNRCLPKGNLKFTPEHRWNCFPYLEDEIFSMSPKVVIACGKVVAEALLGPIAQLTEMRGELCWSGSSSVLVTFSPLYITAQSASANLKQTFFDDIKLAASVCELGKGTDND